MMRMLLLVVFVVVAGCQSGGTGHRPVHDTTPPSVERAQSPEIGQPAAVEEVRTGRWPVPPEDQPTHQAQSPTPEAQNPTPHAQSPQPKAHSPFPHIRLFPDAKMIEVEAEVLWPPEVLEQVMCLRGSREHEALLVTDALPSHIHAALLLAGLEPGSPGYWRQSEDGVELAPPTGDAVRIVVHYDDGPAAGVDIVQWIAPVVGGEDAEKEEDALRAGGFIFGGSQFKPNLEWMDPPNGEHYVADMTGSIVGLVTFGDEVVGWRRVLSDLAAQREVEYVADVERMPAMGMSVNVWIMAVESEAGD